MIKSKIQPYIFYTVLLALVLCASLAHLNITFTILLFGLVILSPIVFDDTKTISIYLFSACFMRCFGEWEFLTALNISLLVLEIKKLIMAIKYNQNKKDIITILLVWLGLLATLTIYSLLYNHFKIHRMAMFIDFVQCVLTCYLVKNSINIKHIIFTLFAGIILSVGISSLFCIAEINNHFIMGTFGDRFGAFFNNVNTLSVYCTLCASCFIVLLLTNKLKFKYYFYFPFIITAVGLVTMSKAFVLMSMLLYGAWFILSFVKSNNKKRFGLYFIILLISVSVLAVLAQDYIKIMIERFSDTGHSSTLNNLTTGRANIWKKYFERWIKSPATFLFGNGYTAPKIDTNQYEHSIYLAFLYQFGIIGTIVIISTLVWTLRKNAKLQRNIACYIPLGIFLFNGLVSNLSGVLCSCLIWFMAFYFITMDTTASPNTKIAEKTEDKGLSNNVEDKSTQDSNSNT